MRTQMKLLGWMGILAAGILSWGAPVRAQDRFCAPNILGWPASAPVPSDGNVASDLGYASAYRYVFANGTSDPHAAVQAVKAPDNSFLYLSIEVFNDLGFDTNNVVVVAFDSHPQPSGGTGTAGPYRRFDIYPTNGSTPTSGGQAPRSVSYYEAAAGAASTQPTWVDKSSTIPAGTVIGVAGDTDSVTGNSHWQIEIKLPVGTLGLSTGDNGFYFNILPVDTATNTALELRWPTTTAPIDRQLLDNVPVPNQWGRLSLSSNACQGIYLGSWNGDISASIDTSALTGGTDLSLSRQNYFHATVHNSGTSAAAVTASFWIANFGTTYQGVSAAGGHWAPIVGITNTDGPHPVNGAPSTTTFTVGPWSLTADQQNQYGTGNTQTGDKFHQCVMVTLDSGTSGAQILTRSAFQNMYFDVASTSTSRAEINTTGLGAPPAGMAAHRFIYLLKPVLQFAYSDGLSNGLAAGQVTAQLGLYAHAFHDLGRYVEINGHQYEILDPGPSFGYMIQHVMPLDFTKGWTARHEKVNATIQAAQHGQTARTAEVAIAASMATTYRTVNAQLASDPEKPNLSDWTWSFRGLGPVDGSKGRLFSISVNANSAVPVDVTISGYQGGIGVCNAGCCCTPGTKVAWRGGSMGMLLAFGALIVRRKRRG